MDWQEETVQMLKAIRSRRNLKTMYKMTRMFYKKETEKQDEVSKGHLQDAGEDRERKAAGICVQDREGHF